MQDDLQGCLLKILESRGLRQSDLAREMGVSQATVSRALTRQYSRKSRSRTKIETYLATTEFKLHFDAAVPNEIKLVIGKVWDKTAAHARIIAGVIESLRELTPRRETEVEERKNDST